MNTSPVRVDAVSKRFEQTVALDAVSLDIGEREIFGLVGPNGAGKTTLIRTILDIIKPDSGTVEIFGRAFQPSDRNRIGYLPEERGLYPRQPVLALLTYLGMLKNLSRHDADHAARWWLERFDLADAMDKRVEQLSKGNQQKVQIAATLLARPGIAVLDEPLSGLDPVSARLAHGIIREYAAEGHTVILSTHQMSLVESLCARVFMIARGRRVLYGALRDIKREHSSNTIRIHSTADYAACPLVAAVSGTSSANGEPLNPMDPVDIELKTPATGDEFLAWLVAHGATVYSFERLSTPLEEIFVRVIEGTAGTPSVAAD
jgi:ABC-2 type transport system ATP-binding protein